MRLIWVIDCIKGLACGVRSVVVVLTPTEGSSLERFEEWGARRASCPGGQCLEDQGLDPLGSSGGLEPRGHLLACHSCWGVLSGLLGASDP